jgi:hypothetical protein
MTTLTLSIREFPKDKKVDIDDLTDNGLLEMIQECDTLKERLTERLDRINNDEVRI